MNNSIKKLLSECIRESSCRFDFWICFLNKLNIRVLAEIGVFRGEFAEKILRGVPNIEHYYMVDPWRNLGDWNKPANKSDEMFREIFDEAMERTSFARNKISVLRGKTTEVIHNIPDGTLDFAYIDGDHTLKGITIDLLQIYSKVKCGGYIGGDDFSRGIWQHSREYEPTLIFPYAVYFAEAVGATIYSLPMNQFLLHKIDSNNPQFSFVDMVGIYGDISLLNQLK